MDFIITIWYNYFGDFMRKKANSNWKVVLLVALIFIGIGIFTFIVHFYSDNKKNSDDEIINNNIVDDDAVSDNEGNAIEKDENDKKDNVGKEEESFKDQEGNEVKISGDKVVSATGFAGASNYKFYLKSGILYFRNIASEDSKEEVIATGVKDLYLENKEVVAELNKDGKIVKENNYIIYK